MRIELYAGTAPASERLAELIAQTARHAVAKRGRFTMAVSGGTEPWEAFRTLATKSLPWASVHVLQVDERVAPAGHEERNFTHLLESLVERAPLPRDQVHAMPVEEADLEAAARRYAGTLRAVCGDPPVLDLVHLGLGEDGHTASLVPGDPVLQAGGLVATTGVYRGRRRMTLTCEAINAARSIAWLVVGERKAAALARLVSGKSPDPAGRISDAQAILIADRAAAKLFAPG